MLCYVMLCYVMLCLLFLDPLFWGLFFFWHLFVWHLSSYCGAKRKSEVVEIRVDIFQLELVQAKYFYIIGLCQRIVPWKVTETQKERIIFQASIWRGELLVSGRVNCKLWLDWSKLMWSNTCTWYLHLPLHSHSPLHSHLHLHLHVYMREHYITIGYHAPPCIIHHRTYKAIGYNTNNAM